MADMIARLKVDSSEYDSKIQRAAKGIQHLTEACHNAGAHLNVLEDENREYIQSLGNMATVATTARGKIAELTSAFIDIKSVYNSLSQEEKNGEFGKDKDENDMWRIPVVACDDPASPDGVVTILEVLSATHKQYHADGISAFGMESSKPQSILKVFKGYFYTPPYVIQISKIFCTASTIAGQRISLGVPSMMDKS